MSSWKKCKEIEALIQPSVISELLDYEPETGVLRWKTRGPDTVENRKFNSNFAGKVAGTRHRTGSVQVHISVDGMSRVFLAHRLAWAIYYGKWPELIVDHVNGDPSCNRIENLREADGSGNSSNKRHIAGSIPYRGVYFHAGRRKFAAQIKHRRKWKWLGLYDKAEDAAKSYDRAAKELHGEFAVTNKSLGCFFEKTQEN